MLFFRLLYSKLGKKLQQKKDFINKNLNKGYI